MSQRGPSVHFRLLCIGAVMLANAVLITWLYRMHQ